MVDALLRILALVHKELLAILKDPRSRAALFGPPILQCLIFGYAASYDLNYIPYAVLDQDRTSASRELLARLDGSGVFHRVANLQRYDDVAAFIEDRSALLIIQIDQEFERRLFAGVPANVQVIADGRNTNTAATAMSYVDTAISSFDAQWRSEHGQSGPAVQVVTRSWYNPTLETRWFMVPALIGTLTFLQTLLVTALSVAREREEGTFDQLLVTPFRPFEIMIGKAVPSMLIGITQATTILLVAQLWFQIPFIGSYFTLYVALILFVLAAVGIGLLISSLVANMQQGMLFSFVILMPFTLLSGITTRVENMPKLLQYLTMIDPLRHAIDIIHRIYLEGAGLGSLVPELVPLAIIGAITLTAASWMFGNRLG